MRRLRRPHAGWRRRGMGVAFVIVMMVLCFLSLIGLGIKYFTQGATRVSESVQSSEVAVQLARAALEDAWAYLEAGVNDPSSPFFLKLREECTGTATDQFSFTYQPLYARALVANDPNVTIDDVTLWCPRTLRIWYKNPLEKYGQFGARVKVTVRRPGITHTAVRQMEQWREFKVLYPSPPRPFQGMTLFTLVPDHLVGYERQYRRLMRDVDQAFHDEEDKLSDKAHRSIHLPRPFQGNSDVYKYYPDYQYPPFPYNARAPKPASYDDPPLQPETDMDNHLICYEPEITGTMTKLRWPVLNENPTNDPTLQQFEADLAQAQAASVATSGTTPTVDPATVAQLAQSVENLKNSEPMVRFENGIREALAWYQRRFRYITQDTLADFGETYLAPLIKVDMDGTITVGEPNGPLDYYSQNRCTHVFPSEVEMWREVATPDGTAFLDGIYLAPGPITVDTAYRGMGTIASVDRLTVNRCQRARPNDPWAICTLMSFGERDPSNTTRWCSIDLQSDVEAGLVCVAGMIKNWHEHNIYGSVATFMLPKEIVDGDAGNHGAPYPWKLTYDPTLWYVHNVTNAVRYDRSRVCLSPTLVGGLVERGD